MYNISQSNSDTAHYSVEVENETILYITETALPCLDSATSSSLDTSYTSDELLVVIQLAKNGKAPGLDGFSNRFYKTFAPDLIPLLLLSFNSFSESQLFPRETLKAHISVILKPGKDGTNPSSYQPISLLNNNIKFYIKL